MTTTGLTWNNLYEGNTARVHKWLYGSVLVRDWDPAGSTTFSGFVPFAQDGNLRADLFSTSLPGGRWYDVGTITEKGVELNPKFTTAPTKSWQSRRSLRDDITEDDEDIMFNCMESSPLVDLLRANLPLAQLVADGTQGYQVTSPYYTDMIYRQLLIIGVDGTIENGNCEYIVEGRPRISLNKKAKRVMAPNEVDSAELTYGVYPDPASGSSPAYLWRGGSVWLGEGGVTTFPTPQVAPVATPVAGGKASIVLAVPTSSNSPFTYSVQQTTGATTTAATVVGTPTVSSGNVTINVSGLTTGSAYTFSVSATGSNGSTANSIPSNSITALA